MINVKRNHHNKKDERKNKRESINKKKSVFQYFHEHQEREVKFICQYNNKKQLKEKERRKERKKCDPTLQSVGNEGMRSFCCGSGGVTKYE